MDNQNTQIETVETTEAETVETTEAETVVEAKTAERRGRKAAFADKFAVVAALKSIGTESQPSRYRIAQLIDRGYVEYQKIDSAGRRGRPSQKAVVTGRGRSYLALSARWATGAQ